MTEGYAVREGRVVEPPPPHVPPPGGLVDDR